MINGTVSWFFNLAKNFIQMSKVISLLISFHTEEKQEYMPA